LLITVTILDRYIVIIKYIIILIGSIWSLQAKKFFMIKCFYTISRWFPCSNWQQYRNIASLCKNFLKNKTNWLCRVTIVCFVFLLFFVPWYIGKKTRKIENTLQSNIFTISNSIYNEEVVHEWNILRILRPSSYFGVHTHGRDVLTPLLCISLSNAAYLKLVSNRSWCFFQRTDVDHSSVWSSSMHFFARRKTRLSLSPFFCPQMREWRHWTET